MRACARCAAGFINAIGLFILIAFLGYGFVEVPRYLMNKANTEGQLRYLKFRVAVQSEASIFEPKYSGAYSLSAPQS